MAASLTTKVNMIFRLADPSDQQAWDEFVEIYTPLLLKTAHQLGLRSHDASDAVQEVLTHLVSAVAKWEPTGKPGAFRGWLVRVARNQIIKLLQRTNTLRSEGFADESQMYLLGQVTAPAEATAWFNRAFRRQVFLFVVEKIRGDFQPKTWQAFWDTYIGQKPPAEAALQLSISVGAVYIARSRVMDRLRNAVENLVEDEWTAVMETSSDDFQSNLDQIRQATSVGLDKDKNNNPDNQEGLS